MNATPCTSPGRIPSFAYTAFSEALIRSRNLLWLWTLIQGYMTKAWNPTFQFLTVTKTLILVLPTDVGIGENKGCRWKEIRFEASQRARLAHNMTLSERDLLCT